MSDLASIGRRMDAIMERLEAIASNKRLLAALLRGRAQAKREADAERAANPAVATFLDRYCGPEQARPPPEVDEMRARLLDAEATEDEAALRGAREARP